MARSVSSAPGGHVGVHWWAGDVPRLFITLNRACSMGLTTVGVAGRPGGGTGGDSFLRRFGGRQWGRQLAQVFDVHREFAQHHRCEGL